MVDDIVCVANYVTKKLSNIKCPALLIHSKADLLSKYENIDFAYSLIRSQHKEKFVVEKAGHNIFISNLINSYNLNNLVIEHNYYSMPEFLNSKIESNILIIVGLDNINQNLINKLDCAIKDFEEIEHLNNIRLLYEMYEN